jgi:tRNA threonylcarbamoyladenosine biosynthesis protein TsaE
MEQLVSHSEADTERIAANFAKTLRGGEVILLTGELGAGKTVFVRGLAKGFGVRGHITSPTFVLMRIHEVRKKKREVRSRKSVRSTTINSPLSTINSFVHVDAYRVRDPRDLGAIGLLEWVGRPDTVVAIEWGERIQRRLPGRAIRVTLSEKTRDHTTRVVRIV